MEEDYGRIRYLRQWYLGYNTLLLQWQRVLDSAPDTVVLNTPSAIALMFNKWACQQQLHQYGVPVPRMLSPVTHYELLREQLKEQALNRVFVKPFHSSSASGVIAYRMNGNWEEAVTSIELVSEGGETKLYNSLKVRKYTAAKDIAVILNYILGEGAIVEEWIPKASLGKYTFDVRVVVIGGKARHVLPRLSAGPLTNLHLGNQRGEAKALQQLLGSDSYAQLLRIAEEAVKAIPGAFYAGVDLLIPAGLGRPRVMEVNSFGDLLPNLYHAGEDTYTAQLTTFFRSYAII